MAAKAAQAVEEEVAEAAPAEAAPRRKRRGLKLVLIVVVLLLVLGGGGGGAWYFFLAPAPETGDVAKEPEPTVPAFVEVKAFVVTIRGADNSQHYLQLGMSLTVPTPEAATAVDQVMPVVLDAMRQTILGYKADDLETGDGVNRMRGDLVQGVNAVLAKQLGGAKLKKLGAPSEKALVQNIYFSSLVVE